MTKRKSKRPSNRAASTDETPAPAPAATEAELRAGEFAFVVGMNENEQKVVLETIAKLAEKEEAIFAKHLDQQTTVALFTRALAVLRQIVWKIDGSSAYTNVRQDITIKMARYLVATLDGLFNVGTQPAMGDEAEPLLAELRQRENG